MKLGVTMFATDYAMRPDELPRLPVKIAALNLSGIPEHTHIPASRRSPWPGGAEVTKGVLAHT